MIYNHAELHNVQDLIEDGKGGLYLSRLPVDVRAKVNERAQFAGLSGSGVEIRFRLLGEQATLILARDSVPDDVSPYGIAEVYIGSFQGSYQVSPQAISTNRTRITITSQDVERVRSNWNTEKQPYDSELVRVLLPYDWASRLYGIEGDVAPPLPDQVPTQRYLAYGSSITHGGSASLHSAAYASRLAEKLRMDLINLGMAGSAQMDLALAEYIARRPDWHIATLEMGVNVTDWPIERFRETAEAFVRTIAEAHSERWIFCTDIIRNHHDYAGSRFNDPFREAVSDIVAKLASPRVIYVNGLDLLTTITGLSSDGLHPSDRGFAEIAECWHQRIMQVVS